MHGKLKAALVGGMIGAIVVVIVELLAVLINDEAFFGSDRSWLILLFAVVLFAWSQMRAYDRKQNDAAKRNGAQNGPEDTHRPEGR